MIFSQKTARSVFAAVGLVCAGLLGAAYFAQYGPSQLQPCPLCILQRYVFLTIAAVALVAAVIGPARLGSLVVASLLGLLGATGAGLALWHVSKGASMTSCDTDPVGLFVYGLPMRSWWPEFLAAYGGCADKIPPVLGISIPVWSLLWFTAIFIVCELTFVQLLRSARR
ncbi:MAG: disulfide bond formation protein B [Usitatibacteraceae bacterium]